MVETLICLVLLAQQPAPPPRIVTGVEGTVVNAFTGQGLHKAIVILRSSDTENGISYAEEVDSNGNFQMEDIQPGEYTITAERQTYYLQPSGAPGAPPPRMKIAAGDRIEHLLIKMAPASSISGRVVDQDGDPVRGATVQVMQYFYVAGRRELRPGIQVQTRDNGEYRLFNMRPGRWFIQVTPRWVYPAPSSRYGATFFPGTRDAANATPVELHGGDELRGYDITMRADTTHSVTFNLPAGDSVTVRQQILYRDGTMPSSQTLTVQGDGKYEYIGVEPGSYVILVQRTEGKSITYARAEVEVRDADVDLGGLDLIPAQQLSGRFKVEGGPLPALGNLRVGLQPDGAAMRAGVNSPAKSDGSFAVTDVAPGRYRLTVALGQTGLYLKSIRLGDQVVSDHLIDLTRPVTDSLTVVLGADAGEIEGSVKKANGDPSIHARMTLFPAAANADRGDLFRFVFSDEHGQFKFKGIAPGEYRLFAWEDVLGGMPQDPDFRKRFEKQSIVVKVAPNGQEKVDTTSISVAAARNSDQ